jgi:hypothetical protein
MQFDITDPVREEIKKWFVRTIASVAIFIGFLFAITILKSALGISSIESHLSALSRNLSSTDDTVYIYQFDYTPPGFLLERALFENKFAGKTLSEIWSGRQSLADELTREDKRILRRIRPRINDSAKRTFPFAVAADLDDSIVSSIVSFKYDVACRTISGVTEEPQIYGVYLGDDEIFSDRGNKRGKKEIVFSGLTEVDEITVGKTNINIFDVGFYLFHKKREPIVDETVLKILDGEILNCTFNAMAFVRDNYPPYERSDLLTWLKRTLRLEGFM